MKIRISIPDDVFTDAEKLIRRLNKSRSQLYTEAIREYLARHDPDTGTEALNRVWDLVEAHGDPAITDAGRHLLERVEW